MTTPETAVPPWVAPYLGDFAAIERILTRTPGFLLQPIDLPSPDLARALADWLRGQGHTVRVIEVADTTAWLDLARTLEPPPDGSGPRPVTVVIASGDPPEEELPLAFARLNMARNRLARLMPHPLLWCGDARLHRWTHHLAPDLASIAGVPFTIHLRQLDDLPEPLRALAPWWWTGAAAEDLDRLEDDESSATDPASRARATLRLAEAHLARGDRDSARAALDSAADGVKESAIPFLPRWRRLHEASSSTPGTSLEEDLSRIGSEMALAHARGDRHEEARWHVELAAALASAKPPRRVEARSALESAYLSYAAIGDELAALRVAATLVVDHSEMPADLLLRVEAQALRVSRLSSEPEALALAALVAAVVAFRRQRPRNAENHIDRFLDIALAHASPSLVVMLNPALELKVHLAYLRGALDVAQDHAEMLLRSASSVDLPHLQVIAHDLLSAILEARSRPRDAARHMVAALSISGRRLVTLRLAHLAQLAGQPKIGRALVAALLPAFDGQPSAELEVWTALESLRYPDEGRALLDLVSRTTDPAKHEHLLAELDALNHELAAQGIDPFDPDTWPAPAPLTAGSARAGDSGAPSSGG